MPSTSVPAVFYGIQCPQAITLGYVHGTSPAAATVTLAGQKEVPLMGSLQTIQIGESPFTGYVVGNEYDPIADLSTVLLVDWRDRLHDFHMRCAFNCEEDDGRFYHILPVNWFAQRKTYVTRELGQFDFDQFQRLDPKLSFNVQLGKNTLYSALSILDWIGLQRGFRVQGDSLALYLLSTSYPLNLDWNGGSTKSADAIQQIMAKCGTEFTCFGYDRLFVNIRGFTENIWTQALEFGSLENFCILGVSSGKIGQELNEKGRRVVVNGDRDRHEFVYPCRINWNPAWTFDMVIMTGVAMTAFLAALGLTLFDKVEDMPEKYHDNETWDDNDNAGKGELPAHKTRNSMLIKDYLTKIAYRAYVVDSGYYVPDFLPVIEDAFVGSVGFLDAETLTPLPALAFELRDFQRNLYYDDDASNFRYPIADSLVTDSNLQSIIYATSKAVYPTAIPTDPVRQMSLVPLSRGASLDVEEVVNPTSGEAEYRVRVFFDEVKVWDEPAIPGSAYLRKHVPDVVLVRLAVSGDRYTYQAGDSEVLNFKARIREQQIAVRNLYRAFLNGEEVTVLRENVKAYWEKRLGAQPLSYKTIRADTIAAAIAYQALAHYAITRSGSVHYDDICGTTPDGIIDNVSVAFSAKPYEGITEDVNFTTGFADTGEFRHPFPVQISRRFKDEEELINDANRAIGRGIVKQLNQQSKGLSVTDGTIEKSGGETADAQLMIAYAKDGLTEIEFTEAYLNSTKTIQVGELIVLGQPNGEGEMPDPNVSE